MITPLAIRLRDMRLEAGLTQEQLAKLSGVGEKSISSFETGKRIASMKVSQLVAIVAACKLSLSHALVEVEVPAITGAVDVATPPAVEATEPEPATAVVAAPEQTAVRVVTRVVKESGCVVCGGKWLARQHARSNSSYSHDYVSRAAAVPKPIRLCDSCRAGLHRGRRTEIGCIETVAAPPRDFVCGCRHCAEEPAAPRVTRERSSMEGVVRCRL